MGVIKLFHSFDLKVIDHSNKNLLRKILIGFIYENYTCFIHTLNHSGRCKRSRYDSKWYCSKVYEVNLVVAGEEVTSSYEVSPRIFIKFLHVKRGHGLLYKIRYLLQLASR